MRNRIIRVLADIRNKSNINIDSLAKELNVSKQQIYKIESSENLNMDTFFKYAKGVGIDIERVVYRYLAERLPVNETECLNALEFTTKERVIQKFRENKIYTEDKINFGIQLFAEYQNKKIETELDLIYVIDMLLEGGSTLEYVCRRLST